MKHIKRTFTKDEKDLVYDLWKQGAGFSDIGRVIEAKPGSVFTILRETGGIKPRPRTRNITHLTSEEREEIRVAGENCGRNRVWRLMRTAQIASQRGYKRKNHYQAGEVSTIAPNLLDRQFDVIEPNKVWVTDITYIRTYESWLFLAVVIDLFSRQVIDWSMSKRINTDLALDALTMACWRRKPTTEVIVHSDQGCQYTNS